jgi:hypothetical protein
LDQTHQRLPLYPLSHFLTRLKAEVPEEYSDDRD